ALAGLPLRELSPEGPLALFSPPREWRMVYAVISGFADPGGSLRSVATALFLAIGIVAALFFAARAGRAGMAAGALAIVAGTGILLTAGAPIEDRLPPLLSPMPLLSAAAAAFLLRR